MEPIAANDQALERAHQYLSAGNYADALGLFESLARDGDMRANVYLGWMHQKGLGTQRDFETAESCYRAAASAGFVLGQYYLASILRLRGNLTEALQWYEQAASQQHPSANYWASVMYREGEGTAPDEDKAERYLKGATSLGHYFAERDLAREALRSARNPLEVLRAGIAYVAAVARGSIAAMRNPDETRLR